MRANASRLDPWLRDPRRLSPSRSSSSCSTLSAVVLATCFPPPHQVGRERKTVVLPIAAGTVRESRHRWMRAPAECIAPDLVRAFPRYRREGARFLEPVAWRQQLF